MWWSVIHGFTPFLCRPNLSDELYPLLYLAWLSPLLLHVGVVRKVVSTPLGLLILRLLVLVGIASFQFQDPHSQAVIMGVGNAAAMLVLCSSWWATSHIDRYVASSHLACMVENVPHSFHPAVFESSEIAYIHNKILRISTSLVVARHSTHG